MAFNVGSITADLELNGQQFIATLNNADEVLEAFGISARNAADESEGFFGKITPTIDLLDLFRTGLGLVSDGLEVVTGLFNRANDAFGEFESTLESLDVALSLRGLGHLSEDLVEFAQQMQDTTQHSRVTTLEVSKFLALAGVGQKDLERFTKVVLDFSAATGIDAATAATQFARTLSGGVSRALTQYLPEVNQLTKAQREAGAVFELGARRLKDFSERLSGTNVALSARLANEVTQAFQDLGEAFDPIIDDALVIGRKVVRALVKGIGENQDAIRTAFASLATRGYDAFLTLAGLLEGLPNTVRTVFGAFSVFYSEVKLYFETLTSVAQGFFNLLTALPELLARTNPAGLIALQVENLLGLDALDDALSGMTENIRTKLKEPFIEAAEGLKVAVKEAGGIEDRIKGAAEATSTWDKLLAGVVGALAEGREQAQGIADGMKETASATDSSRSAADVLASRFDRLGLNVGQAKEDLRAMKKEILDSAHATDDVVDGVRDISDSTNAAADGAGRMEESFRGAADAARDASDAFSGGGGAFGTGGGGDEFGRRQGGTVDLATANAAATAATLQSLERRARLIADPIQKRSARALIDGIAATLRGQVQEEMAAFTSGILSSLNQQGIFDPAQRTQIIQQRVDEARRLGVIPKATG